jgi:tryptophanyl-tRNA synthetase
MRARETAAETMDMVRHAMRIDHFQTPEFLEEMKKKYS